jgi:hypothetical protein
MKPKITKIDFNGYEKNKPKIVGKIQVDLDPFNGCEGQTMRIEKIMESRRSVHSVLVSEWKIEASSDTSQHGHDSDSGEDQSAATTGEWDIREAEDSSLAQDNPWNFSREGAKIPSRSWSSKSSSRRRADFKKQQETSSKQESEAPVTQPEEADSQSKHKKRAVH